MQQRFIGKVAVITGGTSGIGLATAQRLTAEGASVVLAGRDAQRGAVAVAAVAATGGRAIFVRADVAWEEDVANLLAKAVQAFGRVDLMFNNAGAEGMVAPITAYATDAADEVFSTNLMGTFLGTKHAIPALMAGGGGVVVSTASFIGVAAPVPVNAAYAASKAGVAALTASVAAGFPQGEVRAYTICPWVTDTPMMDRVSGGVAEVKGFFAGMNPSGGIASPADVAGVVADLWAGALPFASGSAVLVDRDGATALAGAASAAA